MPSTVLSMTRRNQLVKYLECSNGYSRRSESLGDIVLRASQRVSDAMRDAKEAEFTAACTARKESALNWAKENIGMEDWHVLGTYLGDGTAEQTLVTYVLKHDADGNGQMPAREERDSSAGGRKVISEAQSRLRDAREGIMLTDSVMVAEQIIGDIKVYLRGLERQLTA